MLGGGSLGTFERAFVMCTYGGGARYWFLCPCLSSMVWYHVIHIRSMASFKTARSVGTVPYLKKSIVSFTTVLCYLLCNVYIIVRDVIPCQMNVPWSTPNRGDMPLLVSFYVFHARRMSA